MSCSTNYRMQGMTTCRSAGHDAKRPCSTRRQEFNSKLISLLPLDEVPVTYPFAARAPCDSKGSEWAAKEKPTPISHIFFSTCRAFGTPTRRHALGRLPTPPPPPENLLSDCTENCPLRPLGAPRRFRNPKIGQ